MKLKQKKCMPCEGGIPKLEKIEYLPLLEELKEWQLKGEKLHKKLKFKDFVQAMEFVNAMADLAEEEGHHPDFTVHYNEVEISIWTHAVNGLTENDFILAAKIDSLP